MSRLKRFAVFAGEQFYPNGGWNDYRGSYATLDEAAKASYAHDYDWRHIADLTTGQLFRIPIYDVASAGAAQCDMCRCESPRIKDGVHVDSDRLGLSADTPCDLVFAARDGDGDGWLAYVDGAPICKKNGEPRRFSSVTAAYRTARKAAPQRWNP